jgi:geranylgeranyl diphosphate synthase type II
MELSAAAEPHGRDIDAQHGERIESALRAVLEPLGGRCPPRLREAIHHAVFPGGARLRPRLTLAVAEACGAPPSPRCDRAAAAVELLHCASLAHDDMPCFDGAEIRRGRPTVHAAFGEAAALLTGDALIVLGFEALAREGARSELTALSTAVGPARGLIAGQAWELESAAPLDEYHRAKTAALFAAAAEMGALAAGHEPDPWRAFGELVGRAYQSADDVADAIGRAETLGKPTGRDAALGRPSTVASLGIRRARAVRDELLECVSNGIPPCPEPGRLQQWLQRLAARLVAWTDEGHHGR